MLSFQTTDFVYHMSSANNFELTAQNYVAQLCVFLPPTAGVLTPLPFYLSSYQMWNHSSYILGYPRNPDHLNPAVYIIFKAEIQSTPSDDHFPEFGNKFPNRLIFQQGSNGSNMLADLLMYQVVRA